MSTPRKPFARRITAGLGIAAIAAATLLGSVLPAQAADATPGAGNINPDTAKSLTIHKFAQPDTLGVSPDGKPLPDSATSELTPLSGVTFMLQKVTNIDLGTNEGWAKTKDLEPADVVGHLEAGDSAPTVEGVVTFTGLEQAVYLVTETDPGANNIAFAAKPFLVTLPLPNNTDNTWIYDVHVYPKNSVTSLEKQVDDSQATGLGSNVTWKIAATVPNMSEGNTLDSFVISDTLDARLGYKGATVTQSSGAELLEGSDYTVDTTTKAGTVSIVFTAAGLKKLVPGAQVNVVLLTTVDSLGTEKGVITNDAQSFINGSEFTSNEVETAWGNVVIHKVAANDESKSLQGAEFQVYASEADAKAGSNAIVVSGQTVFRSGNDGIANIDGLRATVNGTQGSAVKYWLVETKAPAGYGIAGDVSKTNPKQFTVKSGKVSTVVDITVVDPQTLPFTLPLTGGPGTVAFMIVGFGLLSIAGGTAMYKRSTRKVSRS